jgi:hypothetical protein
MGFACPRSASEEQQIRPSYLLRVSEEFGGIT